MKKTEVQKQPLIKPAVSAEDLADSIQAIATTMRSLFQSRLSKKAIVALLHAQSKISKTDIEIILGNLENFDSIWLKKK